MALLPRTKRMIEAVMKRNQRYGNIVLIKQNNYALALERAGGKVEYTKGPWKYKQTKVLTSNDEPTYTVYSSTVGKAVARRLLNEDDARLIAAAPELLEALKKIQNRLVRSDDRFQMIAEIERITNIAINKVEGK